MNPSKNAITVRDRRSLQMEKMRLRKLCRLMEDEAQGRLKHVKKNFGAMAFNTAFPHADAQVGMAKLLGYAAKGAFKSNRFKSGLATAIITIVEIVGAKKLVDLFEKIFTKKKKKDKKEEEKEEDED